MKKIVFLMQGYALPVPSVMGGGVEELMTILINNHEKVKTPDCEFIFITKQLYGQDKSKYDKDYNFKNSKIVKVKYNRFFNFFIRVINKVCSVLHINFKLNDLYTRNAYKQVCKINPDHIFFESMYEPNIKKYVKHFGKDKLTLHVHHQILEKENIDKYFSSLVSVSQFISDDWQQFLGSSAMIEYNVLWNCINEQRFNKKITIDERTQIRQKFKFSNKDFVVIFCGRIASEKGIKQLISAITQLDSHIKLLIVGGVKSIKAETTPYLQEVVKLVEQNSDRIKFTGYVKNDELYKYYQSADLQTVPSTWEEAAGLVVVEGQNSGLPQIITQSGGMPEFSSPEGCIVVNKDERLVGELVDAITKIEADKTLQQKMIKANLANCKKFTQKSYYENFMKVLDKIMGEIK